MNSSKKIVSIYCGTLKVSVLKGTAYYEPVAEIIGN